MEERVPPAGDGNDDPPLHSSKRRPQNYVVQNEDSPREALPLPPHRAVLDNKNDDDPPSHSSLGEPLPLPPGRSETYVVQILRDQIYRVPPPEHAKIVEKFRKPNQKKKSGSAFCLWSLFVVIILGLISGIGLSVYHFIFRPTLPAFSVSEVIVKHPPSSRHQRARPVYDITLFADNPSKITGVSYESGGYARLSFKQRRLGEGKYPTFLQEAKNSTVFHVNIAGLSAALPKEIERSMNDKKFKKPVTFDLEINVPIKFMTWMINLKKDLTVSCNVKVVDSGLLFDGEGFSGFFLEQNMVSPLASSKDLQERSKIKSTKI
ncbi:hypothetical protein RJ639_033905 [Escallonia herrerae]|uniref:Late embryogenesis abundant protein LEA-2 subgroup domain-containing protein n=1 Tax=Escallonia herrerae TaxID=1293975 RepID=A0AA88WY95_9ASTE|nr:hypothetical protein RJ639_033905 [Escallonia herrerae]